MYDKSARREIRVVQSNESSSAKFDHVSCEILITKSCNLSCRYCIAKDLPEGTMSEECGRSAIDLMLYLSSGAKSIEFSFSGGEPLINYKLTFALIDYASRRSTEEGIHPRFTVKTNGTIINDYIIEQLKKFSAELVISIDGLKTTHDINRIYFSGAGSWDVVERNLILFKSENIPCTASITICPNTSAYVMESVSHIVEIGIKRIQIAPAYGTVKWNTSNINQFHDGLNRVARFIKSTENCELEIEPINRNNDNIDSQLKDSWGCKAAISNLAFLPDGTITGCSALGMISMTHNDLIIGSVKDGIYEGKIENLKNKVTARDDLKVKCKGCNASDNCTKGCLAINLSTTTSPFEAPRIYCSTIREIPSLWQIAWSK